MCATSVPTVALLIAMTDRVQRLKEARAEAEKEIEAYKQSKEQEFKAIESKVNCHCIILIVDTGLQHSGATATTQSVVDKETEVKLAEIAQTYSARKDDVVKLILDRVVLVQPEMHRNLKKAT